MREIERSRHIYTYIYIYRERKREREREGENERDRERTSEHCVSVASIPVSLQSVHSPPGKMERQRESASTARSKHM